MGLKAGRRGDMKEKKEEEKIPHMCESRCPKRENLLRIQKLSLSSGDS